VPHAEIILILHDIRSSENVGSMFRTADAAGVSRIYLTGYTPSPTDRFGRANAKLSKSALGAETKVRYEKFPDIFELIQHLKSEGVQIIAVEQAEHAVPYMGLRTETSAAFILGNEVEGIPKDVLDACDVVVEIPMHGEKESLNVSVAAGIILFHVRNA
jgi:23S rRNA (guanosine2251-2'-O)-methyltransferase